MKQSNLEIVRLMLELSRTTALGLDGISNLACKFGGAHLAGYILDLVEAFCTDGQLPVDINLSYIAFSDKKPDAATETYMPDMIFRHPLDTRPLSLKQADNKQVAKILRFCISPVVEKCAIDTQSGFIHGRQLVQNPIDLDFHVRMDAYEFFW